MTEIKDIEVRGRGSTTLVFPGYELARVSTERATSSRWVTMIVYAWPGNGFVLARVGESVVYHTSPSPCVSGRTPMLASQLAGDSERCPQCRPEKPGAIAPMTPVIMELPWYSFSFCPGLAQLEEALLESQPSDHMADPAVPPRPSRVTAELLEQVREALDAQPLSTARPALTRMTVALPAGVLADLTRAAAIAKSNVETEIVARLERSFAA